MNSNFKPKVVQYSQNRYEDEARSLENEKNGLYDMHRGWCNMKFGDFIVPTKESRSSIIDSSIANGKRFIKKISQILK